MNVALERSLEGSGDGGRVVDNAPVEDSRLMERAEKRIVVVDDDPQLAELMREFLSEEGYDVRVCSQGDQAFAIVQTLLPDLVILDVRMAEINGLGVLYLLSTDPRTREIPVLLCTAISTGEMEPWQAVLEQKGVPVLYKPFTLTRLAEQVDALVRPAAPSAEPSAAEPASEGTTADRSSPQVRS